MPISDSSKVARLPEERPCLLNVMNAWAGLMMVKWTAAERVALYSPSTPTKDRLFYHDFDTKTAQNREIKPKIRVSIGLQYPDSGLIHRCLDKTIGVDTCARAGS